jgi:hypothetical protein
MVSGMHGGPVEQTLAISPSPCPLKNRHTKLRASVNLTYLPIGQVRNCQQSKFAVKYPKDLVLIKLQTIDVHPNLLVLHGVTKAQIPIVRTER